MTYTDAELLASAREYAFTGLLNVTALRETPDKLKHALRDHFSAILGAIDGHVQGSIDGMIQATKEQEPT